MIFLAHAAVYTIGYSHGSIMMLWMIGVLLLLLLIMMMMDVGGCGASRI